MSLFVLIHTKVVPITVRTVLCSERTPLMFQMAKAQLRFVGLLKGNVRAKPHGVTGTFLCIGGGMSDPFQPAELERGRSLEALKVFAETQYPFIVSTKSDLISKEPYLSLIKECNCVVQFSAVCDRYDKFESGASSFASRLKAAEKISPYKRVNFRVQPYTPVVFKDVLRSIDLFHEVGGAGAIFEGMKYTKKKEGTIKLQGDFVYPVDILRKHFEIFRNKLHKNGMKFYSGENRLRAMGDSLCCCGIDGMGWKPNTANLNHRLYDKEHYVFTDKMREKGTTICFLAINQDSTNRLAYQRMTFEDVMEHMMAKGFYKSLTPEDWK